MKKINATFIVENDLAEYKLREILDGLGAKYVKALSNTEHLKDNTAFSKLKRAKKNAQLELDRFINNNRNE